VTVVTGAGAKEAHLLLAAPGTFAVNQTVQHRARYRIVHQIQARVAGNNDILLGNAKQIRKKLGDRAVMRAMHFFDENERVRKAFDAVESKDMGKFLECINSSGESSWRLLQNCYVPTSLSQPLAFAQAITARLLKGTQYAVRLHGGGFEGTVEAFVPLDALEGYTRRMKEIFGNDNVLVLSFRQAGAIKIA